MQKNLFYKSYKSLRKSNKVAELASSFSSWDLELSLEDASIRVETPK